MKKTILVIEDDPSILEGLTEFLESEDFVVQQASNGKGALDLLKDLNPLPSAIILDLMMPVMDGLQFREAQERDPRIADIPVILVSADHQLEIKKLKMGAVEYLRKPIDIDQLSAMLNNLISRR
jgi:DNA-binding response OmpR family regulator